MSTSINCDLSWYLAVAAVATDFTVSGNLLTWLGSSYISEGGELLQKIHPGSYLAVLSGLSSAAGKMRGEEYRRVDWLLATFLGGIAFCIVYSIFITGTSNVIVYVDTFLPAGMLALTLRYLGQERTLTLRRIAQCLLVLNACIALCELAAQSHLVSIPTDGGNKENEFRPTALYDHALTGSAITMLGLWLAPSAQGAVRWCYILLLTAALLAFGERAPIAAALIGLTACLLNRYGSRMLAREFRLRHVARPLAVALAISLVASAAAFYAGATTRLGTHLYWDDSAQIRLSQFGILNSLDIRELLFGCPRADLLALIEPLRLSSRVAVIENFWLFTLVTLGFFCFPVFLFSFITLLKWLWRMSGRNGHVMLVLFVGVASSSNSLGRKSTLLPTLIACVIASNVHTRAMRLNGSIQPEHM